MYAFLVCLALNGLDSASIIANLKLPDRPVFREFVSALHQGM